MNAWNPLSSVALYSDVNNMSASFYLSENSKINLKSRCYANTDSILDFIPY